ncbi:MAG: sodium ion-translocating decarboxylase subunit beta [Chlorobium sp.]|uniref:sodium ion-translocating decarboxylase subunit beta n=1 Tax=Chlorobium sp. TaxID=1095 RepID=UPI002F419C23
MRKIFFILLSLLCFTTAGHAQQFFQTEGDTVTLLVPEDLELLKVPVRDSRLLKVGDDVHQGDFLGLFTDMHHNKITVTAGVSGHVTYINEGLYGKYTNVPAGAVLLKIEKQELLTSVQGSSGASERLSLRNVFDNLVESTGIYALIVDSKLTWTEGLGRVLMMSVGALLIYLAIAKGFEPLLLIPIGMGAVLSNIPLAFINDEGGILYYIFNVGIQSGVFPLLIFMGVGAMTDFGPMIANPKTSLLGGAAQFGIFGALIGALVLSQYVPGINFSMKDAASIGIIGGADGPTSIFVASRLSPALLGSIAVAAYSYMALVPIIQPPIMKLLTTEDERKIKMTQLRYVSKREKIIFPLVVIVLCALLLPSAAPLIGFLMFGNLMKECGVVDRLSDTSQNALINIVTIFLGLGVGSKLSAEKFLNIETLGIIVLGLIAFSLGTAGGVLMAKFMNLFLKQKINPLIGSAGVSAVPMAARVSNKVGLEADPHNFLLMHAMGPNVSGVIGSAVAAGVLLAVFM